MTGSGLTAPCVNDHIGDAASKLLSLVVNDLIGTASPYQCEGCDNRKIEK